MGLQRVRLDSGTEQREVLSFQRFKKCCFTSWWPPRFLMGKASHPNCPSPVISPDILSLAASKIFFLCLHFQQHGYEMSGHWLCEFIPSGAHWASWSPESVGLYLLPNLLRVSHYFFKYLFSPALSFSPSVIQMLDFALLSCRFSKEFGSSFFLSTFFFLILSFVFNK